MKILLAILILASNLHAATEIIPVTGSDKVGVVISMNGSKRERSSLLTVSSAGLLIWAVGKGIADAHAHSGDAAYIKTGQWWHVGSVAQALGGALFSGGLVYGVASERLTAWEAVRYGAGDLMHKNVIFRAVYTGCRFGEPLTLKPEYNQHLFYFPGIGGEWSIGASHWSHVVAYYGTSYYLGKWLKNNVIASRSFLYPITED